MVIQIDSREQKNEHVTAYFDHKKIKYIVSKMYVGDYQRIDNGLLCIDKKFGLDEVYGCVVSGYKRFEAECRRAQEAGIQLIILTESSEIKSLSEVHNWENPRRIKWEKAMQGKGKGTVSKMPPVSSERIEKRMRTLSKRYGVKWEFCKKEETGKRILELLGYED